MLPLERTKDDLPGKSVSVAKSVESWRTSPNDSSNCFSLAFCDTETEASRKKLLISRNSKSSGQLFPLGLPIATTALMKRRGGWRLFTDARKGRYETSANSISGFTPVSYTH